MATKPVRRDEVPGLGIMQIDSDRRITRFVEKPSDPAVQDTLKVDPSWYEKLGVEGGGEFFLASMGIYVFNRDIIFPKAGGRTGLLDNTLKDFGKHIIPQSIADRRVFSFVFQGYWADIGTIRAFFEASSRCT